MRYLVVAHGDCIDNLILTNDWFWGTRGHNSRNGSGTICDLKSGAVLAARHFTIQGIEEMANHLAGVHDGPGFFTGERRVCRLHAATMPDGTPFQARQWNDCVTFNSEMQAWLKKEIIDQINDIVHPTRGGCCQNASERVGDVALQYRDKETDLEPTHYICSTALAICHVNNVVIHRFRRRLAANGQVDRRIEEFGTMETRLHELIGLSFSKQQEREWKARVATRAKRTTSMCSTT